MDFSEAERVKIQAQRKRYNNLVFISSEKECGFEYQDIPDPFKKKEKKNRKLKRFTIMNYLPYGIINNPKFFY